MFLNKKPETPGQNFKYVSKQHSKIPGLHNLIFNASLPDSALVVWAAKNHQQFNCLSVAVKS